MVAGEANRIYSNDRMGRGSFTVADIAALPDRNSTGVALGDLDGDGDLDAFVVNYGQANRVYTNKIDEGMGFIVADIVGDDRYSSGVALADLDGDGDLDAFVVNYGAPNRIYINDGKGNFTASDASGDMGASRGVGLGDLGLDRD